MLVLALLVTGLGAIGFGDIINILYVTVSGTGGTYTSIQAAIDAADAGDIIRVAGGTYYENILVNESVTLEGGWNEAFTDRNPESRLTTIDGQANGSVIIVPGGYQVTIDGFVITNGNATSPLGWGGGIRIGESFDDTGFTTVRNCVIRDNIASSASPGQGEGGGIHVYNHHALIENNKIYRNTAQTAPDLSGKGGGICTSWMSYVTIKGNEITTNTAALSPIGYASGAGGGIYTLYSGEIFLIEDNIIEGNIGTIDGTGEGGGCHVGANLKNNKIRYNIASKNGTGKGGGLYAEYAPYVEDNTITNNIASETGDGTGGGIDSQQMQTCKGNQILNNSAKRGGGIYLGASTYSTLYHNNIANNKATGSSAATFDGGGGIYNNNNGSKIYENFIIGNTSNYAGGGIFIYNVTNTTVNNNLVQGNLAAGGGGINILSSTGEINKNVIRLNGAYWGGGLYLGGSDAPQFDWNIITENLALGSGGYAGGGIGVNLDSTASVKFTNHIIARNATGALGLVSGVLVGGGTCHLVNCSIVDNNSGTYKEGLAFLSKHGTHSVFNTIVAGHTTGVFADTGVTVVLDYNDYYDNSPNLTGASAGAHDLFIDPQFRDRAVGNYRLIGSSGLVDAGRTEAGVTTDFESDPRPRGAAFDIGADECYLIHAYVSSGSGSDTTGDGSSGNPFASVTKAVGEVEYNATIYVAQGLYSGTNILNRTVHLKGGYEDDAWTRDIDQYATILDAEQLGGVIRIDGYFVFAEVEGFTITGGYADIETGPAGGVTIMDGASATIRYNRIFGNVGVNEGAGVSIYNTGGWPCLIERNRIYNNDSLGQEVLPHLKPRSKLAEGIPSPGGGVLIMGGPTRVMNNFIHHNTAIRGGDGLSVLGGENIHILHNSVAYNGMENGEGIYLSGDDSSYVVYNNIISGHHIGIKIQSGAEVDYAYNCFWDNDIDRDGMPASPHDIIGDPCFADPGTGNFHIRHNSAARDTANTASEYAAIFDIDGNARPNGGGSDIGADEMYNSPPLFHFLAPSKLDSAARNTFLFRWVDEDYDDNAQIRLYWDTDNKDFNGTMLNGIISEDAMANQIAWDTSGLAEGLYYIHVKIDDSVNDPIIKYASYPLIVTRVTWAELIDHILKRTELPIGRRPFAELNNDSGIDIADYIILMNLP
jgi:hypothetical protein